MIFLLTFIRICENCNLEDVVSNTKPYDTVVVKKGVYFVKNLVIDKPLTLIGENWPILDGRKEGEILIITGDSVIVKGFVFKNTRFGFIKDFSALRVKNCKGCVVEGNKFLNNMWAMYWENSEGGVIRNNYINGGEVKGLGTYSGNGIHLWHCKKILIENNTVTGHRDGIYFEFVDSSTIRGNISFKNARYGLHFMYSNGNEFYDNGFYENGAVAVMYSKGFKIFHNKFEKHWGGTGYGIFLKDVYYGEIFENTFYKNTVGMLFDNANGIKVINNVFLNNGYALKIWASSGNDTIMHNDFIGNSFDVSVNNRFVEVLFEKNYYDTYDGYDIDRDGFGDVPHRLVRLFSVIMDIVPATSILLKSPLQQVLENIEKFFPTIIPSLVEDKMPFMEVINYGNNKGRKSK
ncbi:MAG: nitrous oxide reductase family maturation protein NosD [candidate division WOR-3 bacterium]